MLRWRDQEIDLTRLEHDVLLCLVHAPGQVWTYERLHLEVWGNRHLGRDSDMHSVVRRVRGKLARLNAAATIHSVRGVGFRLAPVLITPGAVRPAWSVTRRAGGVRLPLRRQHLMGANPKFSTVGAAVSIFV